jgi:NitT/TauT family transport system permease protein
VPRLFGIHAQPQGATRYLLIALPFVLVIVLYLFASHQRHLENPDDKLLPAVGQMVDTVERMAFQEDARTGKYLMVRDTVASLARLGTGLALAALVGLCLGLNMGIFPGLRETSLAFVTFVSMIPPLAILPILFITFGVDELAKIMLIFIGVFPALTRDMFLSVRRIPREQITKALTLGATRSCCPRCCRG